MSDCLFCQIVAGAIPARVVAENDHALAFYDVAPQAPVHVLVIPKVHVDGLNELARADPALLPNLFALVEHVVADEDVRERGYRLVVNVGEDGQQTVGHLHLHVLGGRRLAWPPG